MDISVIDRELPDTAQWQEDDFRAALWQYQYCLDLLDGPVDDGPDSWSDEIERINDLLFLRDEIDNAGEYFGWHYFDFEDGTPTLGWLDARLRKGYRDNRQIHSFIKREYEQFRDTLSPNEDAWWWRLDCE